MAKKTTSNNKQVLNDKKRNKEFTQRTKLRGIQIAKTIKKHTEAKVDEQINRIKHSYSSCKARV